MHDRPGAPAGPLLHEDTGIINTTAVAAVPLEEMESVPAPDHHNDVLNLESKMFQV
ncbi:MAG: hypothetical protein ACLP66_13480 [Polyangia bacterium]